MEIEVGEYIRTEEGLIGKVSFIQDKVYFMKDIGDYTPEKPIKKHSKNIIDLIGVGDVVGLTEYIDSFNETERIGIPDAEMLEDIKNGIIERKVRLISIITHEQIKKMEYRV